MLPFLEFPFKSMKRIKVGMVREFREFAMRGNVVDMAFGIVIGVAFGKIVSSFVSDIVMPPLGVLIGNVDFSDLAITLREGSGEMAAVTLNYGLFIQAVVDFTIVAFVIFLVVKGMNSLKRKEEATIATACPPSKEATLLAEIRDLLKEK